MSRDNEQTSGIGDPSSRRTFLKATAAAGALVGVGGVAAGQERQEFVFGGEVAGWMGREPSEIADTTNPTLELEPGQEYAFTWENTDGRPHNVAILDGEGEALESTEIINEEGATQTLQFSATEEMAEYVCEVHPASMRGSISFGGETTQAEESQERFMPFGAGAGVEKVAEGLVSPVGFEPAPDDSGRVFILDQPGRLYVHDGEQLQDEPFLDVSDMLVDVGGRESGPFDERGLLGLAFHPEFADNGRFFLRLSVPLGDPPYVSSAEWGERPGEFDHMEVLSEFQASEDLSSADSESETRLLEMPSPQFNHDAGAVAFGPDGYLYVPTGDGGDADDTGLGHVEDWYDANEGGNGQDVTQNLMGGVLRIDVDNEGEDLPYAIPEDNPFAEGGDFADYDGLPEYYAWGLRNPWKASFNDGDFYVASNGQNLFEQVDIVEKGGNYGWNVKEATHCFSTDSPNDPPEDCPDSTPDDVRGGEPLLDPVIEYPHTYEGRGVGVSIIGGYMYNNDAISGLNGKYVFGDYSQTGADPAGRIFAATPSESEGELWSLEEVQLEGSPNGQLNMYVLSFGRDNDGRLYVMGNDSGVPQGETGVVYRMVPAGEGEQISAPQGEDMTTEGDGEMTTTAEGESMTTEGDGEMTTTESE
ncbi:PQQ-dependent sugar dehydrogenase [Halorussus marinus]|uniref:PQQ-dependent sugar dehydrogenase n=1 Tax=Halorussus marinus TaxID=2505976 RepID=UPI00106EC810|nr:PQQ-dependent sugar dehydrogenase [Halorussus marinus]